MDLNQLSDPEEPGGTGLVRKHKWRQWHEREVEVNIQGWETITGIKIGINSPELKTELRLDFPEWAWASYHKQNRVKFIDNVTYIFTAHLPFLLKGNIRLNYNTAYPATYSWANHCFARFLPAYWYLYKKRRGVGLFPLLKTLLNSRAVFAEAKDSAPVFPSTFTKNIIIPFTFGKDSFLTYFIAKDLGLKTMLVYFNEPTELYSREHKLKLIEAFEKETGESVIFMDNPLGNLRDYGEGWFGWELAVTSWALLSLPFAHAQKAAYIAFSNERSTNEFFYDEHGIKVVPDYDQSAQATEELSLMTQSLSEGEVFVTTFLQGLEDLAIMAILRERYFKHTFKNLMSCWAETDAARDKRWCGECSKCARIYSYLVACGIDPIKEAGFLTNMFMKNKSHLYNVFGKTASGTGWDAFGLNVDEQSLAFYLAYLRGCRDDLVVQFTKTDMFEKVKNNFHNLVERFFSLHDEAVTPLQWKKRVDSIFRTSLSKVRQEIHALAN